MYNSLSALPSIPYNIMTFLTKDEILWKILKYGDYDALSYPDLTFSEKMDLVWAKGPQEKYSVFFTNQIDDLICESKPILKIYQYYIHANSLYHSTVVMAFDFLFGGQSSMVEYNGTPVNRGDLFVNRILNDLNGAYVGGVGKLSFNDDLSRYCLARSVIGNSKNFTGECIYLAVNVGDTGEQEGCQ